jgi:hypothetical protein
VGINPDLTPSAPLFQWTWTDTFNGSAGGIPVLSPSAPIDPGSGVGYITITSLNGVPVPAIVPPTQMSVQASGLAYSRVTQTFNGTVTITNIGSSTVSTPTSFQVVFNSLPAGVVLANSAGTFNQCPYVTVPVVASLAPSESATVSVRFQNPSGVSINFAPEVYAGSFQ